MRQLGRKEGRKQVINVMKSRPDRQSGKNTHKKMKNKKQKSGQKHKCNQREREREERERE